VSERVERAIREAIEERGPIPFDEFMELALYAPGGFYDRPPVGPRGHFVTAPHVHGAFGELLAGCVRALRDRLGRDPATAIPLVEVGAGNGTLAAQLLERLGDEVALSTVERSEGALRTLRERFGDRVSVARDVGERAPIRDGVIIANELLDNMPFRRVRASRSAGSPVEVRVGVDSGRLVEVEVSAGEELTALVPRPVEPGAEHVVPTGALAFLERSASALERGYALLIDYGSSGGDAVHGYREHAVVEDVLDAPGSSDITAGVDFDALAARAGELGLRVDALVTQRDALLALGFEGWLRSELDRQRRLMNEGAGLEAVRTWGGRSRATLLVDPAALGRLRWMLLAGGDVPPAGDVVGAGRGAPDSGSD